MSVIVAVGGFIKLVAIIGVTAENVGGVIRAGAAGVAVISAISAADDISTVSRAFLAAICRAESGR